jgi:hypothetical protein
MGFAPPKPRDAPRRASHPSDRSSSTKAGVRPAYVIDRARVLVRAASWIVHWAWSEPQQAQRTRRPRTRARLPAVAHTNFFASVSIEGSLLLAVLTQHLLAVVVAVGRTHHAVDMPSEGH